MSGINYINLLSSNQTKLEDKCDVCIIGAGAVGIYLASQMANKNLSVVLIETGDIQCKDSETIGFNTQFLDQVYPGATRGRAFGLGGSTSRWGGLLAPHSEYDVSNSEVLTNNTWNHIIQKISEKQTTTLKILGFEEKGISDVFNLEKIEHQNKTLNTVGINSVSNLFIPFQKRNFVSLLKKKSIRASNLKIYTNAVTKTWSFQSNGKDKTKIRLLSAVAENGNILKIAADEFIIAAGAIESARILLEINQQTDFHIINSKSKIGCYLSDHLSVPIADVADLDNSLAIRKFGPWFSKGWMQSYRFLESDPPADSPKAFSHYIFNIENSGFTLAKEIFQAIQSKKWKLISPKKFLYGVSGITALAYSRYIRSNLYIPSNTKVHLQLDIEQEPHHDNRITLGNNKDKFGRLIPKINWSIREVDFKNIRQTADRILIKWELDQEGLPKLLARNETGNTTKPHDTYHPVGVCRMGEDEEATVDLDMKVYGTSNLWVVSTGILPSAGSANPTFTILCLAETLIENITTNKNNRHSL